VLCWLPKQKKFASRSRCRDDEPVSEFLQRLDVALGKAMAENTVINEVLPEIQRRRSRKASVPPFNPMSQALVLLCYTISPSESEI